MRNLYWSLIGLMLLSCQPKVSPVQKQVDKFIELYKARSDFEQFLALYHTDMVLEDMITGYRMEGRDAFAEFFNWPDKRFEKISDQTIVVQSTVIENNRAVIQGYFTPFKWDATAVEAMQFTTLLYFDENANIIRHVDWINYPNQLIDYENRMNSNQWINDKE